MTKKVTKREMFNAIKAVSEVANNEEMVAFIDHEIELLDKKASKSGKPTATQEANENLKIVVLDNLSESEGKTVSDLIKSVDALSELSNQKVSAILRLMIADGTVRKGIDKKKALFFKVGA